MLYFAYFYPLFNMDEYGDNTLEYVSTGVTLANYLYQAYVLRDRFSEV